MRLNPQQAPLYGECVLTVQLDDDDVCRAEEEEEEDEVEFYLLFSGSTQSHVSSTLRVRRVTLQAVCPAHNVCEQVLVTLCWARPSGPVDSHSQETFCFVQDLALDMAHFLLDSTGPQEALLLDDEQIPLRECERLDESLALALKHLSMPHHRTANADVDRQMCHQTHTSKATDTYTQSDTDRNSTEIHKEPWMDVSTQLDSCSGGVCLSADSTPTPPSPVSSSPAASQSQQLCSLLHLAAGHGLRTVASFLLLQPGARDSLRRTDARGQTAVGVAESRGHQQLVELFTEYEASSGIQVEPKEELHLYPERRVFQHHANLDTYTLTSTGCGQREGGSETGSIQEEVEELRRLIRIHRHSKGESHTATPVSPASGWQLCSNRQPGTRQDAGLAVVTTGEQGSPPSLEERTQGAEPAYVTQTSCTRGQLCQSQEAGEGLRATPAANCPAGQNRKSKKRTTKTARRATESAGNRNTSEAGRETARGSTKTLGSGPEKEETVSAAPSVCGDRGVTETQHSPGAEETPLPRRPLSALGGDGMSAGRKAVALPTTTVVEKQEEEEKEVDVLIYEQATETERENPPEGRDQVTSPLGPAAHRTVTMGQEQSQEHQETQSDPEEPSQPDSTNKSSQSGSRTSLRSPDVERKPRRLLWRDGGWIGSTMGPPPCGLETVAKTVWYQGDNLDQGVSEDSQKHEVNSQSVWYDSDVVDERKHEQLEQAERGLSSTRAPGLSPPQLSEQGLSSRQQCAALTQPHTAGAWPAPSHGSAAQRREVHGSQRGEEVEPDCKEGGEEGDHTETSYSRESCEPADIEETPGGEERGAKSRKKRRKKRGRRGEAKLSSSSSIESQSQGETQALREPVTNLSTQSEIEPEAQDLTGEGLVQSPTVSEPAQDQDAMHPPSQTKSQSRDTHGPDCDITASDSSYTGPTDHGRKGLTEATESSEDQNPDPDSAMASDLSETEFREDLQRAMPPGGEETLEPSELDSQTTAIPVHHAEETKDLSAAGGAAASVDPTGLLESRCLKELPVRHSDPTALTEDLSLVEFPEHNTQHVQSVDSKPGLDSVALPCEGPPLQTREGRIEPMEREHFEQRLSSEMLRDQEHERQKGGDEDGWGEETSVERTSEENDSQMLRGEDWSFTFQGEKVEDEDFPSSHRETECSLVATAVAVVAVAVASAVVSVELRQHAAGHRSDSQQSADGPLLAQNANITQLMECVCSSGQSTHTETSHLSADTEDQLRPLPEGPANTDILEESHPIPVTAAQLYHTDEANLHTPRLPKLQTDEVQPATTQNKLGDHMRPVPHKTITAGGDSRAHMQTETQLSCPGVDTGRDPESPNRLCPESESKCNPQDQYQARQTQDRGGSLPVESAATEGEGEGRGHEQDSPGDGCHPGVTDRSDSPCEGKGLTVTLPVGPCDWAPVAGPCPEPTVPLEIVESQSSQSSQSLVDMKLITAMFHGKGPESVAEDDEDEDPDPVDTVDGWKQREKDKREREEEARRQEVTEEDTSHTQAEPFQQESEGTRRDSNSTQPVQIQREGDVFYPVQPCPQPCPQPSTGTSYAATEECVSVCVSHRDTDSLTIIAELDDSVFKKPDPPPSAGLRGRGVCVSCSSDHALMQAAPSPSEGAWSGATPDTVVPQSSRLSWKSETKDRGGGGEEEEQDWLPENPVSSAILRGSIRSLSPFRRHSWEPGRNNAAADLDVTQHSSLKSLPAEVKRAKPPLHRRSMSWCPSNLHRPDQQPIDNRSYSLEGLEVQQEGVQTQCPSLRDQEERSEGRCFRLDSQERGSLVSLTEEEQEGDGSSIDSQTSHQVLSMTTSCPAMFHHQTLTKSISMVTISHRDEDVRGFPPSKQRISFSLSISPLLLKNRHCFSLDSSTCDDEEEGEMGRSFSSNSGSLEYSISEEEPGPLRSDTEGKGGAKISRTFSYLRSKMSKKGKEKEKERRGEKERESKEREKKSLNNHVFIPISPSPSTSCQHCTRPLHKDSLFCNNCGVHVHKSCKESVSVCTKSKAKQQLGPEAAPGSAVNMRSKSTSSASSLSSTSSSSSRERWSTVTIPDDQLTVLFPGRRHPSFFTPHSNLAKSISTSNIAGLDDVPLRALKFLSQSTDSLHQGSKVNASTESLTDEGTEMMDSQLMGEFECDMKDLEADSWSSTVDKKFLKTLKKDEIKRQDVIYELYQTEFHHVRTLKIMSEVYYKGLQREVQLETDTLDKIFPVLDDLLLTHTEFLTRLLETKRASSAPGHTSSSFLICRIGDVLVQQFSDCSAERMKKVYGKFCSRHSEAVNLYKDLQAKDKRFQAFIKRTMSSSIVRRLSIPECILLVTQRITKYPVLIQRILQHTKDSDGDHSGVCESLRCVKDLIAAVDSKVNEQEKKCRLREVHSRTDSKSIMRMKSGQMFAKEDLIRGRKLLHDGVVQLKNSAGRLKDVRAMLLSDVLVFLQEKDQKYVFASLDQRSTVISLQNLIVREVANEERGLFLITAGTERPEMVEVLASSKEERNTWRAIIQDAMHCMEKDEDEGVPSETEEDRRQQENRAKEIRELLRRKDEQIVCLLEEKVHIFRELGDCNPASEDTNTPVRERMLFRATPGEVTKGEPIIHDALREVESLHTLVCSGVGAAGCSAAAGLTGGNVGPVCLPRRAETFGGFDSHQMNSSKSKKDGDKEEGEESLDLRRTESDSVLKKGATASLQMLLKRNNEQVQLSVIHLHDLLISLQAVVVQQDSFVEDQRQALNDRLTANSSRHSSSSSLSSSSSSRPSSLIEQEKHRSLERQRQEAASLQKQQAAHQEEKRRREKEWDLKEKSLAVQEERLRDEEEETRRRHRVLLEERETLQRKKEEYHRELERLREAQRRLERDQEALRRDSERLESMRTYQEQLQRSQRTPSTTSEDSIRLHGLGPLDLDPKEAADEPKEVELSSSAPTKEPFLRIGSKRMGKNFNLFSSSSSSSSSTKPQGAEKESQLPSRLRQLAKPKEKKKKKGKGGEHTHMENKVMSDSQNDGDIFFC